jgi:nicotinate-nucleotide--dimethylbenzimidazole phosphoribosyltransferase
VKPSMTAALESLIAQIALPDEKSRRLARLHLDMLTKPPGSLGRLEDLAAQFAAIRGETPREPLAKAVYIFAADHGVTAEGVSAFPREVTRQMVLNFLANGAAVNVLARVHNARLHIVDVGVDADFYRAPGLLHHKIRNGTRNMLHEAAMSEGEVSRALTIGAQLADEAAASGATLVAVGEMGIGNTTSASAITCALTGVPATFATGHGTGVDSRVYAHKVHVVEAAVARHFPAGGGIPSPLEILRCVGGLEIAAMTGFILHAARNRVAIIVDGFISTAAAALAVAMQPNVQGYLIAGHRSEEPGHQLLLDSLNLEPLLSLGMRLGEGTGALLAMGIVESAIRLYIDMATFASASISGAVQ